jgi:hypothetical protein
MDGRVMMLKTLNFIKRTHFFQSKVDVIVLALGILVVLYVYYRFSLLQDATAVAQATLQNAHIQTHTLTLDENTKRNLEAAKAIQADLTLPWMQMLNVLEGIKKQTPKIDFISIEPNKKRADIRIKGESKQFENITQLIELLSKEPMLKEVALLNQHVEEVNDEMAENGNEAGNVYVFEISMGWHV